MFEKIKGKLSNIDVLDTFVCTTTAITVIGTAVVVKKLADICDELGIN